MSSHPGSQVEGAHWLTIWRRIGAGGFGNGYVFPQLGSHGVELGAICDLDRMPWRDPISHALPYFAVTPTLNGSGSGILERPW